MPDLHLGGCRVEPLGSYLKALGVLRLVAEQVDPSAAGWWVGDEFWLRSSLDDAGLIDFFVNAYSPTPLLAPWNKGSGFGEEDATKSKTAVAAVAGLEASSIDRLSGYRTAIASVQSIRSRPDWYSLEKEDQVTICRNELPDDCLRWLDATVVLTSSGRAFPPLLGTGGNDGRFDFASNFMQRLAELFGLVDRDKNATNPRRLAQSSLFALEGVRLDRAAIGQFDPAGAGGPGSSPMGSAESLSNPWDFVLLLEGALVFASAAARRLSGNDAASVPFIVSAAGAGYASAALAEKSRGEIWAPLWGRPTVFAEVSRLISEGRAEFNGRQATTGLDLARSLATLGVDRGLTAFARHGFIERNGLATFAVPLGRIAVAPRVGAAVLGQIDGWVNQLRYLKNAPDSLTALLRRLDDAQFAVAAGGGPESMQRILLALAELDASTARSRSVADQLRRPLVGSLVANRWVPLLDDGSHEFELAVALASLRSKGSGRSWIRLLTSPAQPGRPPVVTGFGRRPVDRVLADCLARLAIERPSSDSHDATSGGHWLDGARPVAARLLSVEAFLARAVDDDRLASLLAGLCLLDWRDPDALGLAADERDTPPHPAFALVSPFFHPGAPAVGLTADRSWPRMLAVGAIERVIEQALRRLRIAGLEPVIQSAAKLQHGVDSTRLAAACLLPVSGTAIKGLLDRVTVVHAALPSQSTNPKE